MTWERDLAFHERLRAGPRQLEVLDHLILGESDAEIAAALGISITTVRTYLVRLYRDNGYSNRTQAVVAYVQHRAEIANDP